MDEGGALSRERMQLQQVIDAMTTVPAFLRDRHLTVLASNPLARAVSPSFEVGVNLARFTFLDPIVESLGDSWPGTAGQVAAELRDSLEQHEEDGSFRRIIGELSAKSDDFAEAWADDARPRTSGTYVFPATPVGDLTLTFQMLQIPENYDDVLVVWRATPASASALTRLVALLAGDGTS